jgi:membrane dipeptidase
MIGSDLDGAFGREQCPSDVHTIADLAQVPAVLRAHGYSDEDLRQISHGNFLRVVRHAWNA